MRFEATKIPGVVVVEPDLLEDERGFFARVWCRREFAEHGLRPELAQCSISWNRRRGTLRGMHLQGAPHAEAKLVRVTRGAVFDVALDLRPDSPSFRRWFGCELSEANRRMLYIPEGLAHGFLTLTEGTEVAYQISEFHRPEAARGVRWDDPAFAIEWPERPVVISERDRAYPDFAT
jgi:dTDP-4-dehydrorhamnose 3,5-epimerase